MAEEAEDEFEEDEDGGEDVLEDIEDEEVIDIDHLIDDIEAQGGRATEREPAWRRLERFMEDRRTKEEISDFEDYDIDD